mmetsp:Transcript_41322/g.86711  ORF Transcript_41322/g.86711 Transcript_41322/m.86711 type:complete len:320 (-) Transcript_41322:62-1021(-)
MATYPITRGAARTISAGVVRLARPRNSGSPITAVRDIIDERHTGRRRISTTTPLSPLIHRHRHQRHHNAQQQQQQQQLQLVTKHSYSIGDEIPKSFMTHLDHTEMKMALLVSKLEPGDTAFVKRSSGKYYSYSQVTNKDRTSITFAVNSNYDTKTFDLLNAGKYVRIVSDVEMEDIRRTEEAAARAAEETRDLELDGISVGGESNDGAFVDQSLIILPDAAAAISSLVRSPTIDEENDGAGDAAAAEEMVDNTIEEEKEESPVVYKAGVSVQYRGAGGEMGARILDVHLDDELVPYYTIKLEDGREKQTDNAHLSPVEQ